MSKIEIRTEKRMKRIATHAALGFGALLLSACATTAPPPELVQARKSYDLAAGNPTIIEHAPVDLFEASKAVDRAEAAFEADADGKEVKHLAFLATKQVEIADAGARSRAAKKEALRLKELRERTRYEARAQEAAQATRDAAQARAQVDALVAASQYGAPGGSGVDRAAAREARLAQRELELDNASLAQRLQALEAARANERRPADLTIEVTEPLRTGELEGQELAAAQRAVELQAAIEAAEERLQALEASNDLAQQEMLELQLSREADERKALATQMATEAADRRAHDQELDAVRPARRELIRQTDLEIEERKALELQEAAEARERRLHEQAMTREIPERSAIDTRGSRFTSPVPRERAPEVFRERAPEVSAESAESLEMAARADRRARDLEAENSRLRGANDALRSAIDTNDSTPREPERRVVVVTERAEALQDSTRAVELESALAEERNRTAELAAREEETLASVSAARAEAERASLRAAELERERAQLQEWNARLVPGGIVLTLHDLFTSNQAEPRPEALESLQRLSELLKERPDRRILIEGHTDSMGADRYNLDLSQKRAEAVRGVLEGEGIPAERMKAAGAGETRPAAPNKTADGRKRNRRIEVKILDAPTTETPEVTETQEG